MPAVRDQLNVFARRVALAVQASTRVRADSLAADASDPVDTQASLAHLPAAGWLVGLAACLAFALVAVLLPGNPWGPAVAAIAAILVSLWLTRGRNEAGLLRAFEAMQPGQGFGTVALVVVLVARIALLAAIAGAAEPAVMASLLAAPVVSRLAPLVVGHGLAGGGAGTIRVAVLWCVIPLLLMVPAGGLACPVLALIAAGVACWAMLRFCRRHAGGAADHAAAAQQVTEVAFLFGAALGA